MGWVFLVLVIGGIVGGLLQAVPQSNEYLRRGSGGLIALGFLGVLLWTYFLTGVAAGVVGR
ncbi:MAG: hypothetical protein HY689_16155 [Chloroflexi bacterium]|nr:hypothetical protein [Chloroflexota bacterium]